MCVKPYPLCRLRFSGYASLSTLIPLLCLVTPQRTDFHPPSKHVEGLTKPRFWQQAENRMCAARGHKQRAKYTADGQMQGRLKYRALENREKVRPLMKTLSEHYMNQNGLFVGQE